MNNDETVFNPSQNQTQQVQSPLSSPGLQNVPLSPGQTVKKEGGGSFIKGFLKKLLALLLVLGFIVIIIISYLTFFKNSNSSNGEVTLSYWGLWEDNNVMQGIISDFERQNPKIKVEYSKQDIKQYRERLETRINNGTGPDIFRFHNTWYPMLSGLLLPLPSDTISKDEFLRSYYPVMQKDLVINGAIYGIPLEVDTLSLFINTQLFQSAGLSRPVTWNDFINAARAMTVKDENKKIKTAGAAIGTYDNIIHAPDILSLLFLQNGVDFKNIAGSSDRIQGALNFYTSFAADDNKVWDNTLDPSILAFSKGNL
ncbi:MAG TPA: extracellular solute-binding protein, partial [Candidatus Sulfotelmatobacter sp.]|nr:extracellular solute-binding protein [Candidatus Sulfotelmatobacter sp.]